ncbi:MAG: GNAT family N-acetyltransferase [Bacilli bacterium]|nr:GNAT family N-acetyltransferase [Bacilli bacterium]
MLVLISALDVSYESLLDYCNEFNNSNDLNSFAISLIKNSYKEYIEWVQTYEINATNNMYFLVDMQNINRLIGYGCIENSKTMDYHETFLNKGAIGYGVRPSEREKGYGNIILDLLIKECNKLGIKEICISCLEENNKSKRIIESHNGKLEKKFFDDENGKYGFKYWIKLNPSINCRIKRLIKEIRSKRLYIKKRY